MIPSYMWGYICDKYGRRKVMIRTLIATSLMALCSSLAPTFYWFLFFRFWTGFFVSASSGGMYPYLGEFNTLKHRPTVMAWCSCGTGISMTLAPAVAWYILSLDINILLYGQLVFHSWRLILIVYTLPGLIAALLLTFFPESPKFLISQGLEKETLEVLNWIHKTNTGDSRNYPVKRLAREIDADRLNNDVSEIQNILNQTKQLLKPPFVKHFLIAIYIQTSIFISSGGMGLWFPEILNQLYYSNTTGTICSIFKKNLHQGSNTLISNKECNNILSSEAFVNSIIVGLYYTFGYIIISVLMKYCGRGLILELSLLGSSVSGFLLQWTTNLSLQIIYFSSFLVLSGLMISVISSAAVMLFPTHVRAMAVCCILMIARIGTSLGSSLIGLTIEKYCEETFGFITSLIVVSAFLNFFLPAR
ncbi:synaptic vesicle glycoprotein 2A-like isoform X2 [Culicoides brevitarsis]